MFIMIMKNIMAKNVVDKISSFNSSFSFIGSDKSIKIIKKLIPRIIDTPNTTLWVASYSNGKG